MSVFLEEERMKVPRKFGEELISVEAWHLNIFGKLN